MEIQTAIKTYDTILKNGPLGTRLKYDYGVDPMTDLLSNPDSQHALTTIYKSDLEVAKRHQLPMILNAPTFRASKHHLHNANLNDTHVVKRINTAYLNIVKQLRDKYHSSKNPVFTGAAIGSMYDAYSVETIPGIEVSQQYHQEQIQIFETVGVDIVTAATLPTINEAMGIALTIEKTNLNYLISFVLNKQGTLLDGTTLDKAIALIDQITSRQPSGYAINCTHASVLQQFSILPACLNRVIGILLNGSALPISELVKLNKPMADSPEQFAQDIIGLKKQWGLTIIAGCCGTTSKHLHHMANILKGSIYHANIS